MGEGAIDVEVRPCASEAVRRLPTWLTTSEEVFAWAGARFRHPLEEAQLDEHLRAARDPGSTTRAFSAIDARTGELVGHGELTAIDPGHGTTVMRRIVVAPGHRRRGVGRTLVTSLVRIAFQDLGLHRVEVRAFTHNHPAKALYRSVGFQVEGEIREYRVHAGERLSAQLMGLLRPEWVATCGQAGVSGRPAAIA